MRCYSTQRHTSCEKAEWSLEQRGSQAWPTSLDLQFNSEDPSACSRAVGRPCWTLDGHVPCMHVAVDLSLSFSRYKMSIVMVLTSGVEVRVRWDNQWQETLSLTNVNYSLPIAGSPGQGWIGHYTELLPLLCIFNTYAREESQVKMANWPTVPESPSPEI